MSKKAELTIILPNYNSQLYLKKTLQSITSQSYQKWNLIIVDDNSNVETKKILNKFGKHRKIKIFYLKVNRGAAYCRNFALKKIKSKYVAFIDLMIFGKNKLKLQVDFMKKINMHSPILAMKLLGKKEEKFIRQIE